jgi:hypothetical protein
MDEAEKTPVTMDREQILREIAEDREFIRHAEQQNEIRRLKFEQAERSLQRLRRIIDRMAAAAG